MIVRNEEECLPYALESTVGLADEIVVVDTGSTDATLDIARDFGCRVFTGADRMHKAESRNRAMEEASGDWIVVLDADERVTETERLRAFIQETEALALYIRAAYIDESEARTMTFSQLRCWERGVLRYKYRAHELPIPADDKPKLAQMTDFLWEHRPPPKREKWKLQYTLDRLLLDVEENHGDPRPVYYLGRQHMYMKQYKKAVGMLRRYVAMGGSTDIADCWYSLARCYRHLPNHQKEHIMSLHQACAIHPRRREYWGELANEHWRRGNHQLAIGLLQAALRLSPLEVGSVQHAWYSDIPEKVLVHWIEHADGIRDGKRLQVVAGQDRPAADRPPENRT